MTYPKQIDPHAYDIRYRCGHQCKATKLYGAMSHEELDAESRMLCPECRKKKENNRKKK
ncbi:MAG: hypothetical protein WCT05_11675 [Lentisphaeria bacterium]